MPANQELPQLPAVGELLTSGLDKVLAGRTEPAWLTDNRRNAWKAFQAMEMPFWRRTNLRQFSFDLFRPTFGIAEIRFTGQEGVIVRDMQSALRERPDLMDDALGVSLDARPNKFTALHGALWQDGVFVYVPKNVVVEEPIRIVYRLPEAGAAIFPHTLVVAEPNSSVTVVEEFVSDDLSDPALCIPAADIIVNDNAEVRFLSVQSFGRNAFHIGSQFVSMRGKDSRIWWLTAALGGRVQHLEMEIYLGGNGSHADWLGVNYANEQQNLVYAPIIRHVGLHTEGSVNFRSVVDDEGYAVFDGLIKIEKGAQGTNSDLRDNALHLGPKARSDSIPGLEIDANDVKAGHGSTSGPIDPEQVFYLRSRGLPEAEALRMVVMGFISEVVDQIPVEDLHDRVVDLIAAKI
ncbi:MAG: Fe-S cluster assembly protein SufD [Herpetosiphonaceae bacterium]|nr:MAG: Fe-S cluster assembly protein SufD [Herpetosiphonaceae bacterium]